MTFVVVDHLVVAAPSLAAGVAWCEATLGVTPGPGGKHPLMGTHNRLLKIATAAYPNAYLEIIAIDPEAPDPGRKRWFGLDTLDLTDGPRLVHWVGRSPMLDMHRWGLITIGHQPGDPVDASRETAAGTLSWQILVRADGQLEAGGALPTLIQWRGAHPAEAMPDSGVTLQSLAANGISERACDVLRLRGVAGATSASGAAPALSAALQTPRGTVTLETR
jgi:Glyoxalase-like domain